MSRVSPKTTRDRFRHTLSGSVPDLEGNVYNEPTNFFENWTFLKRDERGFPEGMDIGMPEEPTGYWVYVSEKDKGPRTMSAQNTQPVPIGEHFWLVSESIVQGHRPRDPNFAAKIANPPQPRLKAVPPEQKGFKGGNYWISYSYYDKRGRHTTLAPAIQVFIADNQHLKVFMPDASSEDVAGIGLWMSPPGGAPSAQRLQKSVSIKWTRPEEVILKRYKSGRKAPSKNETEVVKPVSPTIEPTLGETQSVPGDYQAAISVVTANGETQVSDYSNTFTITEQDANQKVHMNVVANTQSSTPSGHKRSAGAHTGDQGVYATGESTATHSESTEKNYKVYVKVDGDQEYVYYNQDNGSPERPIPASEPITTGGHKAESAPQGESGVLIANTGNVQIQGGDDNGGGDFGSSPTTGVSQSSTEEQGISAPTSPLEDPSPLGEVAPEGGKYWIAVSFYVNGEESLISQPKRMNLPDGKIMKVIFRNFVNYIINAKFGELDARRLPFGFDFTGIGTGQGLIEVLEGIIQLRTNGPKTTAIDSPTLSQGFDIDRAENVILGGEFDFAVTSGKAQVVLKQVSVAVDEVTGDETETEVAPEIVLEEIEETGITSYEKLMGPDGTPWAEGTQRGRILYRFESVSGSSRNGIMNIYDLFAHPTTEPLRRREPAIPESRLLDNADPPAWIDWPKLSNLGVELPPRNRRVSPETKRIEFADFGESVATMPAGWNLVSSGSGVSGGITTGAKIDGSFGYNIKKTNTFSGWRYLHKTFEPIDRLNLGVRSKIRVNTLPTLGDVVLLYLKSAQADGHTNGLAYVSISPNGDLKFSSRATSFTNPTTTRTIATGIIPSDVLDVELIAQDAHTVFGSLNCAVGKNGQTRQFADPIRGINWATGFVRCVQLGVTLQNSSSDRWDFDFDSLAVTETGDVITDLTPTAPARPIPRPDRPTLAPVYISQEDLEDQAFTSPWTAFTGGSATSTIANTYALDGTYGVRFQDLGSTGTGEAYAAYTLTSSRESLGVRSRFKVNQLPTVGTVRLMDVRDTLDRVLAYCYMDTTGTIWAQPIKSDGSSGKTVKIAKNLALNSVVTLELVVVGAGTQSGMMTCWYSLGGTGSPAERKMYAQEIGIDWSASGAQAKKARAGGFGESASSVTWSFYYDSFALTEKGEIVFREFDEIGQEIAQLYIMYIKGQPQRNDLHVKGVRFAVEPGGVYTCAIYAKHAGVIRQSFPFSLTAYDSTGKAIEIGCLYGEAGCIGTEGWAERKLTFTIPQDCYELELHGRNVGAGRWICQELAFSKGTDVIRPLTYTPTSITEIILDTDIPYKYYAKRPEDVWLNMSTMVYTPSGTSATVQYRSTETLSEPVPDWETDPDVVPEHRFAHIRITMNASSDQKITPKLITNSPYVDQACFMGNDQVGVLLREDLSHFPGGVFLDKLSFPTFVPTYDVREPRGKVRRHKRWPAVGRLEGLILNAFTEDAIAELEQTALEKDFFLEARGKRMRIRFKQEIAFEAKTSTSVKNAGIWHVYGKAEPGRVEVSGVFPIPELNLS